MCRGPVSSSISGSVVGIEGSQSLRRASSIRRTYTTGTAGIKRKSVCLQVKFQVDGLIETLRRTRLRFVHCFLPQHNAGLCDLKTSLLMPNKTSSSDGIILNVPLVRSQLRGVQILDAVRIHKQGFPEHMLYAEFRRRFELLAPPESRVNSPVVDEKHAVETLVAHLDVDKTSYRLGLSQIFFRSGTLAQLEEQKDDKIQDQIIQLQAHCRGHLAKKKLAKLKVQDLAVRCIQKNVRKFLAVRDWPWWRLLVKVAPLLNVHRTEEELKVKTEELEALRLKVEKLEKERLELKHDNSKLEARLSEMTADLAEEHSTSTLATERLEAETAERMKLEKEVQEYQTRNKTLQQTNEQIEMELLYSRAAEMNGDLGSDEDVPDTSIYKQKYDRVYRELEFTKKRLQQQHEDDLEQLVALKKQLEKKLFDAYEEVDEQRQVVAQWKRKVQRITGEMNDVRLLLEEQTSRNALLEKKQRKFDAELQMLQDELKQERCNKERLMREKEGMLAEKYSVEQAMNALKLDMELKDENLAALNKELDELTFGGKTEEEIAALKRSKHEMNIRIKDQEEELDDLAGQVQLLEQAKLRLEMSIEQMRKEHRKEMNQKDEEMEDCRSAVIKKVKALEAQLENEHDERTALVREKHELERCIIDLQERGVRSGDDDTIHKLKKDLKRTKALLKDAQTMLERTHNEIPSKVIVRQLKNQLEDAEFARTAAVKARSNAEMELQELQGQLEDVMRAKAETEEKLLQFNREKAELQSQLDENEEELVEVMKKYKATVQQLSVDQISIQEQAGQIGDLEFERNNLREQLAELTTKMEALEGENVNSHQTKRLQLKVKELESKLELELTTRGRMEVQINRLKEAIEKLNQECESIRIKEQNSLDSNRKLQRNIRELKEDYTSLKQKEIEASNKKSELEKQLELTEAECVTVKNDLKIALKRIEDLQSAIQAEVDSETDGSDSDGETDSSETSVDTFLANHRITTPLQLRSNSPKAGSISNTLEDLSRSTDSSVSEKFSDARQEVEDLGRRESFA